MSPAQALYESLGFCEIAPYRSVEFGDTVFYELSLEPLPVRTALRSKGGGV